MEGSIVGRILDIPKGHMPKGSNIFMNFEFCLIVQQKLDEADNIASNHYIKTRHLKRTPERILKVMSTSVNKERAMLSSGITKQLAIADIKLTYGYPEEVKHHWGSFSVLQILQ